jgi:hypothetical protein
MPNQNNFRNEVISRTESRFLASRIVRFPQDGVLLEEIPASFGYDYEDNVELHFYTAKSNTLVQSLVTKLSDGFVKLHIVGYDDGTYKTYLQIDFTRLFTELPTNISTVKNIIVMIPGDYKVSINFFSDEIGNYNNKVLTISEISPSRTEIETYFNNSFNEVAIDTNDRLLYEFVTDSFIKADAIGVMKKILKDGVESGNDAEGLTANNIIQNINVNQIQTQEQTINKIQRLGLEPQFVNAINAYLPKLFEKIREEIVIGDELVQADELENFLEVEIKQTIQEIQTMLDSRISIA